MPITHTQKIKTTTTTKALSHVTFSTKKAFGSKAVRMWRYIIIFDIKQSVAELILYCVGGENATNKLCELSLVVFKAILDGALSNMFYWEMSLPMAGRVEQDDL